MSDAPCYLCGKAISAGQSFYEDHGAKVCLACFRTTARCQKCRFPSTHLKRVEGFGTVCEFCYPSMSAETGLTCHLCEKPIFSQSSHYADHGKAVCQECFKNAAARCFTCRFPQVVETISSHGGVCEFCREGNLTAKHDLSALLSHLQKFLKQHGHTPVQDPKLIWVPWKLILGMQMDDPAPVSVTFFDEMVRHCYPVYYLKGLFYVIPSIPAQWFLPYMAGQMAVADLCRKYQLAHLMGTTPFHEMARGWSHWIAYRTAKVLKYDRVAKTLGRWPESGLKGNFSKFQAMSEFRKPKEVIAFAWQNLGAYAQKYL